MNVGNVSAKFFNKTVKHQATGKLKPAYIPNFKESEVVQIKYDRIKGEYKIISNIPNTLDSICWYTLDKSGKASIQSCWMKNPQVEQNDELKEIYKELHKNTLCGLKPLNNEKSKEIRDRIVKVMHKE